MQSNCEIVKKHTIFSNFFQDFLFTFHQASDGQVCDQSLFSGHPAALFVLEK